MGIFFPYTYNALHGTSEVQDTHTIHCMVHPRSKNFANRFSLVGDALSLYAYSYTQCLLVLINSVTKRQNGQ